METEVSFGLWLAKRRKALDLTRNELARKIGSSTSALRKIESDERRPSRQLAELLAKALEIPTPEHSLFVSIARGEISLERLNESALRPAPSLFPLPQALSRPVPIPPTPLIGRETDLTVLRQMLADAQCRLITLVGPGGSGKTRLAMEIALEHREGAAFIPLANVHFAALIGPAIAGALGFTFYGTAPPRTQLLNYLHEKQMLLVLDNMEHLLEGADLIAEILECAPRVKLLCTSREPFNLRGEWVFEVGGLSFPSEAEAARAEDYSATTLFIHCARRAMASFLLNAEDARMVARICALVEGMPLAIELAAAWVRTLSCREIAQQIEGGLDILVTSTRDIPDRHRSIQAVFDHSWNLLSAEERCSLARLSVFRGGFRRETAARVYGTSLMLLSALVAKSLVHRNDSGRYQLHELVRQYASEKLAEQTQARQDAEKQHGEFYLNFFSEHEALLKSSAQPEAIRELTAEIDNLRLAWKWAILHNHYGLLRKMAGAFVWFYDIRGWLIEGIGHLDYAIQAIERDASTRSLTTDEQSTLGRLLTCHALLTFRQGNTKLAETFVEQSLKVLLPIDAPDELRSALTFGGVVKYALGNYEKANEFFLKGLQLMEKAGDDRWIEGVCLSNLGLIAHVMGRYTEAHEKLHASVAASRETGDPRLITLTINLLTPVAIQLGRFEEADNLIQESIDRNQAIGDRWGLGMAYRNLGLLAEVQNKQDRAKIAFQKSLELFRELGAQWDAARTLADLGRSKLGLGEDLEAEQDLQDALRSLVEIQGIPATLDALASLASLRAKQGQVEQAFECISVILNHKAALEETRSRAGKLCSELEACLTPSQVEAARASTFEKVIAEILNQINFTR